MAFKKGQSGNPGGRPKQYGTLRDLARKHTETAVNRLVSIVRTSESDAAAATAASAILDRGWGKPLQAVEHSGPDGGPIEMSVEDRRKQAVALIDEAFGAATDTKG